MTGTSNFIQTVRRSCNWKVLTLSKYPQLNYLGLRHRKSIATCNQQVQKFLHHTKHRLILIAQNLN